MGRDLYFLILSQIASDFEKLLLVLFSSLSAITNDWRQPAIVVKHERVATFKVTASNDARRCDWYSTIECTSRAKMSVVALGLCNTTVPGNLEFPLGTRRSRIQ